MAVTVREAKKAQTNMQGALDYCVPFLAKSVEHQALGSRAAAAAAQVGALRFEGREADEASPGSLATLASAVALGIEILASTDAGRKLPRVSSWIEESQTLIG